MRGMLRSLVLFSLLAGGQLAGEDALNMIGRQSQNEGILVVPKPGDVKIDGDLADWDWSGRIWVFADKNVRDDYSTECAAMWDKEALYFAAKWHDPTPMYSNVDPEFKPDHGWRADAIQMRLDTSDQTSWLTTWYFTGKRQAVLHRSVWKTRHVARDGQGIQILKAENGKPLGQGVEMVYKADADGTGFVQEMKIPWSLIFNRPPEIKSGVVFRMGLEFLWGDATGGERGPIFRYADNMQPGVTQREFYWTAFKSWGNATLVAKGNVPVRQYVAEGSKLPGTMPVRADIPENASGFTIAIEDNNGKRIRNLAGDFNPLDYSVAVQNGRRTVEVLWDCLDDNGKPVKPGTYNVRGLYHRGVKPEYDMTYYNPGTPPWHTADGQGAWGSNHADPRGVARAGERMIVYWPFSEGGHAIIGLDSKGHKIWGELTGATELTADSDFVYAVEGGRRQKEQLLFRLAAEDGAYRPFVLDGKNRPLFLPLADVFGKDLPGEVISIDSDGRRLAVAFSGGVVFLLDASSAKLLDTISVADVQDLAFAPRSRLHVLAGGALKSIDLNSKSASVIPTPGMGKGTRLDVDNDGNIVIVDSGSDCQVKAYSADGKLVYTAGTKGGRPRTGKFDGQAMTAMSSVAVDAKGDIWVAEQCRDPRRISVWGRDGKLVRDYIGGAGYAGCDSWLHETDQDTAYVGSVEMKLDRSKRSYKVNRILWSPDRDKGQAFPLWRSRHWFSNPHAVVSSVATGKPIRYIYCNGIYSQWHAVYQDDGSSARPVAAVAYATYLQEAVPGLDFGNLPKKTVVFWSDRNGDSAVSKDECVVGGNPNLFSFWGNRMGDDLSFYIDGVRRVRPVHFTKTGAPVYAPEGVEELALKDKGEFAPIPGEGTVLCLSKGRTVPRVFAFNPTDGKICWSYPTPYAGVHGSHKATMPKPGLMLGTLKICGVADLGGSIGKVFAVRGNLGQDYYLTTDGLYITALFEDCRLPGKALPAREAELREMPLAEFSEGGEPFNGWFGRHRDGKIRMLTSIARTGALIACIEGLDTIERFNAPQIIVDEKTIAKALADNASRLAIARGPKRGVVSRLKHCPTIDGDGKEWQQIPLLAIQRDGAPDKGSVRIAYDRQNLYALFNVSDSTPWRNEGKDYARLFKTGDAVDIQIGPGRDKKGKAAKGDQRIVIAQLAGKPVAVLMRPIDPDAPTALKYTYSSPVTDRSFDHVQVLSDAQVAVRKSKKGYTVEVSIPLKSLGLRPKAGGKIRGDFGFISSDAAGIVNVARTYWSNKNTNLVNDLPMEAQVVPGDWGELTWE